jgi:hypothetical protein
LAQAKRRALPTSEQCPATRHRSAGPNRRPSPDRRQCHDTSSFGRPLGHAWDANDHGVPASYVDATQTVPASPPTVADVCRGDRVKSPLLAG